MTHDVSSFVPFFARRSASGRFSIEAEEPIAGRAIGDGVEGRYGR